MRARSLQTALQAAFGPAPCIHAKVVAFSVASSKITGRSSDLLWQEGNS